MVQIPAALATEFATKQDAGSKYLQELVNFGTEKGWEFFRIDTLGHLPTAGCQVVTFRRLHPDPPPFVELPHPHHAVEPVSYVEESVPTEEPQPDKPWWR